MNADKTIIRPALHLLFRVSEIRSRAAL